MESKQGGKSPKLNQNLDGSNLELTFDGRYLLGNFGKVKRSPSSSKEKLNLKNPFNQQADYVLHAKKIGTELEL